MKSNSEPVTAFFPAKQINPAQRIMGTKCPSVVPFEILHSEGPFEVGSFEHFGLERHFNMAAMIVLMPKFLSEVNFLFGMQNKNKHDQP